MIETRHHPITLEEMIPRNQLLEHYPWISTQILNRWQRTGAVRVFPGHLGMRVYAKSDIERAIMADMEANFEAVVATNSAVQQSTVSNGQLSDEAVRLREKRSQDIIWGRARPEGLSTRRRKQNDQPE